MKNWSVAHLSLFERWKVAVTVLLVVHSLSSLESRSYSLLITHLTSPGSHDPILNSPTLLIIPGSNSLISSHSTLVTFILWGAFGNLTQLKHETRECCVEKGRFIYFNVSKRKSWGKMWRRDWNGALKSDGKFNERNIISRDLTLLRALRASFSEIYN